MNLGREVERRVQELLKCEKARWELERGHEEKENHTRKE